MSITYIWLSAGVVLALLEAIGFPGLGLLFAGLGAIVTGALLSFTFLSETNIVNQFIVFCIATAGWAALLWKPMQRLRHPNHAPYNNMVGETGYVGSSGLTKDKEGEVTWSGTIMKAKLIPDAQINTLEAGAQVTIVSVTGATLIVKPKS